MLAAILVPNILVAGLVLWALCDGALRLAARPVVESVEVLGPRS